MKKGQRVVVAGFSPDELRVFDLEGNCPAQIILWSSSEVDASADNGRRLPPRTKVVIYNKAITSHFSSQVRRIVAGKRVEVFPEKSADQVNAWVTRNVFAGFCTGTELWERRRLRAEWELVARQARIESVRRRALARTLREEMTAPVAVLRAHNVPLPLASEAPTEHRGKTLWLSSDGFYTFVGLTDPQAFIWLNANYAPQVVKDEIRRLEAGLKLSGLKALSWRVVERYYYKFRQAALKRLEP